MVFSPKIIVITGIDGSGKTTISSLLEKELQKRTINVRIVQQFAPILIPRKILERFGSTFISMERQVADNKNFSRSQNTLKTRLLRTLAILRILSFGYFHTLANITLNIRADSIISDRYFFDNVLKVNWLYNKSYYDSWFLALVPMPDLIVYLDVPPEVGWKRETDGNTTLSQHVSKKQVYDEFYQAFRKNNRPILKIDALLPKEEILAIILHETGVEKITKEV
jgi:thymidylate kinase